MAGADRPDTVAVATAGHSPVMQTVDYRQFINRSLPLIERCCTSKALFTSRREARSLVRNGRRSSGALKPYHCRSCRGWHLGHPR